MQSSRTADLVVAACAASGGAHLALAPQHMDHQPALGVAFVAASCVLLASATTLTLRDDDALAARAATLTLAALLAGYALAVTTGIPWLADEPEPVDLAGLATKSAEALGLLFSIQLNPIMGGRGLLTHQEARQ